jgi:hypothetical protein
MELLNPVMPNLFFDVDLCAFIKYTLEKLQTTESEDI